MTMKHLFLSWYSILTVAICVLLTVSCEKEDNSIRGLPRTPEEIAESIILSRKIVTECSSIVEDAISKAYNQDALVDPQQIAKDIRLIDGVLSASPTSTGTTIVVQQEDSIYLNIQIVTGNDQRFFIDNKNKASELKSSTSANSSDYIIPNGDGKALILAPFQSSFNTNLDSISELLHNAGYKVDIYSNEEAKLDYFRGSFLNNYDVVYIKTHGSAEGSTRINGVESTGICYRGGVY